MTYTEAAHLLRTGRFEDLHDAYRAAQIERDTATVEAIDAAIDDDSERRDYEFTARTSR